MAIIPKGQIAPSYIGIDRGDDDGDQTSYGVIRTNPVLRSRTVTGLGSEMKRRTMQVPEGGAVLDFLRNDSQREYTALPSGPEMVTTASVMEQITRVVSVLEQARANPLVVNLRPAPPNDVSPPAAEKKDPPVAVHAARRRFIVRKRPERD